MRRPAQSGPGAVAGEGLTGVARVIGGELGWWAAGGGRLLKAAPKRVVVWAALVLAAGWRQEWAWLAVVAGVVLVPALWCRLGPESYRRQVTDRLWRRRLVRRVRRCWDELMEACGLGRRPLDGTRGAAVVVPDLRRLYWRDRQLVARPVLLPGQTVDDVEAAADRLRVAVGARRIRILVNAEVTGCEIAWLFGDQLAEAFPAAIPSAEDPIGPLESVPVGRVEDGRRWQLRLRVSTLVVGATGAGKASLMWGLLAQLGPAIKAGVVEVCGIDLKGGMELALGRALFTRYATSAAEAVALLEEVAAALQSRARLLAGVVRTHQPTVADPLVVVVVDELAALIAYQTDRDLLRRAEAALSIIASQGRAPGFCLWGFAQDPRKETIRSRHLFTQTVALRLQERDEVVMVLGEGAVAGGAACHRIPRDTPGVGYVLGPDGKPVRVRAGYVSDPMIRQLAGTFPAPRQFPITAARPASTGARSTRSRSHGGES